MKAIVYREFGGQLSTVRIDDPTPPPDGAVIRVEATGLCRSDWHGWRGHDADIKTLPHVPGHEFAGVVEEVGNEVDRSHVGKRVTMPFVAGCGTCRECRSGNQQVCDRQFQPAFTGWGTFAEYVAVRYAANNLVPLPNNVSFATAAAMGCRFGTAFRAVCAQGRARSGSWLAVHGCGGVGLSAVMIAHAINARVIAVDIRDEALSRAKDLGAEIAINATSIDTPAAIRDATCGGADISIDALGGAQSFTNSILSLRKRGRHVQVGLLTHHDALSPASIQRLIAWELEIAGSHGIQARAYPEMFELIAAGKLDPSCLIERTLPLEAATHELASLDNYRGAGITIFTPHANPIHND